MTLEERQACTTSVDDHLDSLLRIQDEDDELDDITLEERISKAFSDSLREVLTDDEWDRMKRDNAQAARLPNVCHSHDYVDANEYMYSAIQAETSATWFDAQTVSEYTEEFCELWNRSWDIAQDRWLS